MRAKVHALLGLLQCGCSGFGRLLVQLGVSRTDAFPVHIRTSRFKVHRRGWSTPFLLYAEVKCITHESLLYNTHCRLDTRHTRIVLAVQSMF